MRSGSRIARRILCKPNGFKHRPRDKRIHEGALFFVRVERDQNLRAAGANLVRQQFFQLIVRKPERTQGGFVALHGCIVSRAEIRRFLNAHPFQHLNALMRMISVGAVQIHHARGESVLAAKRRQKPAEFCKLVAGRVQHNQNVGMIVCIAERERAVVRCGKEIAQHQKTGFAVNFHGRRRSIQRNAHIPDRRRFPHRRKAASVGVENHQGIDFIRFVKPDNQRFFAGRHLHFDVLVRIKRNRCERIAVKKVRNIGFDLFRNRVFARQRGIRFVRRILGKHSRGKRQQKRKYQQKQSFQSSHFLQRTEVRHPSKKYRL